MQIFYDHSFVVNLVCIDNVRNGILSMTCPPVNKLGTPFGPPTFGIMSQQTILGEMHSLSCNIYIYIYIYIYILYIYIYKVKHHQLLNSNLRSLAGTEPETHFKALRIITNHI